jgi:two-component system chemotaxis sensor kinase CheA
MSEIVKELLVESYESLDRMERALVAMETAPLKKETLGSIFRAIDTIKSRNGFLSFGKLEAVAKACDTLLSKLRDGVITFNAEIASALLAMVDAVRSMLGQIEVTGRPGDRDFTDLVNLLTRLNDGRGTGTESDASPAFSPAATTAVAGKPDRAVVAPMPEAMVPPSATPKERRKTASASGISVSRSPVIFVPAPKKVGQNKNSAISDTTIRLDLVQLDELMSLLDELSRKTAELQDMVTPINK